MVLQPPATFEGEELDVGVLMWDIRCTVDARALPPVRNVVEFVFTDQPASCRCWWIVNEQGSVDLCKQDPGDPAAMEIQTTLRTLTRVWMGDLSLEAAQRSGRLRILGSNDIRRCLLRWLRLSPYAPVADARRTTPRSAPAPSAPVGELTAR